MNRPFIMDNGKPRKITNSDIIDLSSGVITDGDNTYSLININKVKLYDNDDFGYLLDKLSEDHFEFDPVSQKIKVKDNILSAKTLNGVASDQIVKIDDISITNGNVLFYDATAKKWVSGLISDINEPQVITNFTVTNQNEKMILQWDKEDNIQYEIYIDNRMVEKNNITGSYTIDNIKGSTKEYDIKIISKNNFKKSQAFHTKVKYYKIYNSHVYPNNYSITNNAINIDLNLTDDVFGYLLQLNNNIDTYSICGSLPGDTYLKATNLKPSTSYDTNLIPIHTMSGNQSPTIYSSLNLKVNFTTPPDPPVLNDDYSIISVTDDKIILKNNNKNVLALINVFLNNDKQDGDLDDFYSITNLTGNTSYDIKLNNEIAPQHINNKEVTAISNFSDVVTLKTAPKRPQNIYGQIVNNNAVITWDESEGADSYSIFSSENYLGTSQTNQYSIINLSELTDYNILISSHGNGYSSSKSSKEFTSMESPYNITIPTITDYSINMIWDNNDNNVDSYELNTGYNIINTTDKNILLDFSNDEYRNNYSILIASKHSNFKGLEEKINVNMLPRIPSNYRYDSTSDTYARIQWDSHPEDDSYSVFVNYSGGPAITFPSTYNYQILSGNFDDSYSIFVKAHQDNHGSSKPTETFVFNLCAQPSNISVSDVTTSTLNLSWHNESSQSMSFNVYQDDLLIASDLSTSILNVSGLTPDTGYKFTVRNKTPNGEGPGLDLKCFTVNSIVENLNAVNDIYNHIHITWDAKENADYYRLYNNGVLIQDNIQTNEYDLYNPLSETVYNLKVTVVNDSGESLKSDNFQITSIKQINTTLTKMDTTDESIKIKWTPDSDATDYNLYLNESLLQSNVNDFSFVFDGLTEMTDYHLGVSANVSGNETYVKELHVATACKKPINFSVQQYDEYSITLQWDLVNCDYFYIECDNLDNGSVPSDENTKSYVNLTPGRKYKNFKLRSYYHNDITDEYFNVYADNIINQYTKAEPCTNFTIDNFTNNYATISWDTNNYQSDTLYEVHWDGNVDTTSLPTITTDQINTVKTITFDIYSKIESYTSSALSSEFYSKPVITNLSVSDITENSALISWDDDGSDTYAVYLNEELYGYVGSNHISLTKLSSLEQYKVQVRDAAHPTMALSDWVLFSTPLAAPSGILKQTFDTDVISFKIFDDNNTGTPDSFKVYVDDVFYQEYTDMTSTVYIDSLLSGKKYNIKITNVKDSIESEPYEVDLYTLPDKVTNITITNITSTSFDVSFDDNQPDIDFYKIRTDIDSISQVITYTHQATVLFDEGETGTVTVYVYAYTISGSSYETIQITL